MKSILRFLKAVFNGLCFIAYGAAIVYAALVVITSGYEHRLVDNQIKRAWHVRLPGYQEYLDLESSPPVHRTRFVIGAYYRVGPWIEPDPILREEPDASP